MTNHLTVLGLAMLISAPITNIAMAQQPGWAKLPDKASFIHGDDLVTDAMQEPDAAAQARMQTPQRKAAGLSSVMVTRDGDVYESPMAQEDVALFEEAILTLEALDGMPDVPGKSPRLHAADGQAADGHDAHGRDVNGRDRVAPDSVIGPDNRTRINRTTDSPYRHIGRVATGCTGTLVGPKHVLTAGHCVSDGKGNFYSSLNVSIAQNGSERPWGTSTWSAVKTTSGWLNGGDTNYDYALIVLDEPPHGGYAGYGVYQGDDHSITGYPGDKPRGTMWTHSGPVSTSGSYRLCYTIDTYGGNSGSGIADSGNFVRGVHTTGGSRNCGTRLTSTVYNTIQRWINENP